MRDHFIDAWAQLWMHAQTAEQERRYAPLRAIRLYDVGIHLSRDETIGNSEVVSRTATSTRKIH